MRRTRMSVVHGPTRGPSAARIARRILGFSSLQRDLAVRHENSGGVHAVHEADPALLPFTIQRLDLGFQFPDNPALNLIEVLEHVEFRGNGNEPCDLLSVLPAFLERQLPPRGGPLE